jgi:hypothetical protein
MLGLTQSIESDCARESTAFSWPVWAEPPRRLATGVHPVVIRVVLSAIAWFLAVTWLNFAADIEVDLDLAVVTGFFVMFLTLFLLTASLVVNDPRWRQRKTSFAEFLDGEVAIDTYTMRGREVLIHISMLPITLAAGGTLIGFVASMVRLGS